MEMIIKTTFMVIPVNLFLANISILYPWKHLKTNAFCYFQGGGGGGGGTKCDYWLEMD